MDYATRITKIRDELYANEQHMGGTICGGTDEAYKILYQMGKLCEAVYRVNDPVELRDLEDLMDGLSNFILCISYHEYDLDLNCVDLRQEFHDVYDRLVEKYDVPSHKSLSSESNQDTDTDSVS
jgi:hypothetical protein